MRLRPPVTAILAVTLAARAAWSGNDDELFVGNRAAMSGGAVSATVSDSSSIWYNPAGLGAVDRAQIDVSGTAYTVRLYSAPRFLSATSGESVDGSVTEFVSIPTQIAYVRRLAPGFSLGLGYFVPHASNFVLREGLQVGTPADGSQWQVAATLADVQHTAAAGVGAAISPNVRVGVSLIGGYSAITQAASFFGAIQRGGQTQAFISQTAVGTASRVSLESGLGLQIDLSPSLSLGVSCRTPRIQLYESADFGQSQGIGSIAAMPVLIAAAEAPATQRTGFNLLRAGRAGVALAYRYGSGWIAAEVDVQPALHRPERSVDRNALVNARLGVYHPMTTALALGAGVFTDRSADVAKAALLSGSGDFYGGSLGMEFSNKHLLADGEPVDSLIFSTVFALRYAFSDSEFGRAVVDPDGIGAGMPFREAKGSLKAHELGFYVGSGLSF